MHDGFIRTAAATCDIKVADCAYNAGNIPVKDCLAGRFDRLPDSLFRNAFGFARACRGQPRSREKLVKEKENE